jgi:hypothetical protein
MCHQQWIHMQACMGRYHEPTHPAPTWHTLLNPNAMDTSTRRTQGCLTTAKHVLEQYAPRPPVPPHTSTQQQHRDFSNVSCYTCHQKGHISHFCPQKQFPNTYGRQEPRNAQTTHTEETYEPQVARADTRTVEEKAKDWLAGIAGEDEEVKEKVLQELWKKEDFGST